ncbi:MAG: hypothetical protein ABL921_17975 [Pirellula sp.]
MNRPIPYLLYACAIAGVFVGIGFLVPPSSRSDKINSPSIILNSGNIFPRRIDSGSLTNAIRVARDVISGGQPEGQRAFQDLKDLGVKTIISVDGAKPDVHLAKSFGMRYIHLPHGYNGIPASRILEISKAVSSFDGPIYIHCHHGKHRSPAAAAAACVALGLVSASDSMQILKLAGTSENYRGLFQSVQTTQLMDPQIIESLQVEFQEVAELPPIAETMVAIERYFHHLEKFSKTDWRLISEHPDLDPVHESLMLGEHFTELLRLESEARRSEEYLSLLRTSADAASELVDGLRAWRQGARSDAVPGIVGESFAVISNQCNVCHRQFRDVMDRGR